MSESKKISDQESRIFRESVGQVRPVDDDRHTGGVEPPAPLAKQLKKDEAAVMDELLSHEFDPAELEIGEEMYYLRPGVRPRVLQRLRRGQYSVQDEIDLHHMNQTLAHKVILEFIEDAQRRDLGCIKIIHGKGMKSGPDGPKIKVLTNRLLRRHKVVMAFASARSNDGGTGAVYVLLSRKPAARD